MLQGLQCRPKANPNHTRASLLPPIMPSPPTWHLLSNMDLQSKQKLFVMGFLSNKMG